MNAACLLLLFVRASVAAPAGATADTIVVCPQEFRAALTPWLDHRTQQGHTFAFVSSRGSAEDIRRDIRAIARTGKPRFILLVGDADPAMQTNPAVRARCVPTHYSRAKVTVHWGSEPEIATDNWYADLDDDRLPDVAIGRLPADSAEDLSRIVKKIIDYEQCTDFGAWRRRINLVAGVGGFGKLTDTALEMATKRLFDGIPASYSTSFTYGSWQSPFCPNPRDFRATTIERMNEGSLFWVYVGHGNRRNVDWLRVPGGAYPIFTDRDIPQLQCRCGSSIACFFACYAAAFDQREDCLAEEMLRQEGGPVAVLGGSRVTMPYATALLGSELLEEVFFRRSPTLGEALLAAKRKMVAPDGNKMSRAALDALAVLLSPRPQDLAEERAEHLDLYTLIGDPALALRHPQEVRLEIAATANAGGTIAVSGTSPLAGTCTVELVAPRGTLRFSPPARQRFDADQTKLAEYNAVYAQANDPCWASVEIPVSKGQFKANLDVPATVDGSCQVRAFVAGVDDFAAGAADIQVRPARAAANKASATHADTVR